MIWYLYIKRKKRQTPRRAIVAQKLLSNKLGFQCWVYHGFINCHLKCKIPCILKWSLWRPPRDGWSLMFCIELSVCYFAGHWRLWFWGVKMPNWNLNTESYPRARPTHPPKKKKSNLELLPDSAMGHDHCMWATQVILFPVLLHAHHSGNSSQAVTAIRGMLS